MMRATRTRHTNALPKCEWSPQFVFVSVFLDMAELVRLASLNREWRRALRDNEEWWAHLEWKESCCSPAYAKQKGGGMWQAMMHCDGMPHIRKISVRTQEAAKWTMAQTRALVPRWRGVQRVHVQSSTRNVAQRAVAKLQHLLAACPQLATYVGPWTLCPRRVRHATLTETVWMDADLFEQTVPPSVEHLELHTHRVGCNRLTLQHTTMHTLELYFPSRHSGVTTVNVLTELPQLRVLVCHGALRVDWRQISRQLRVVELYNNRVTRWPHGATLARAFPHLQRLSLYKVDETWVVEDLPQLHELALTCSGQQAHVTLQRLPRLHTVRIQAQGQLTLGKQLPAITVLHAPFLDEMTVADPRCWQQIRDLSVPHHLLPAGASPPLELLTVHKYPSYGVVPPCQRLHLQTNGTATWLNAGAAEYVMLEGVDSTNKSLVVDARAARQLHVVTQWLLGSLVPAPQGLPHLTDLVLSGCPYLSMARVSRELLPYAPRLTTLRVLNCDEHNATCVVQHPTLQQLQLEWSSEVYFNCLNLTCPQLTTLRVVAKGRTFGWRNWRFLEVFCPELRDVHWEYMLNFTEAQELTEQLAHIHTLRWHANNIESLECRLNLDTLRQLRYVFVAPARSTNSQTLDVRACTELQQLTVEWKKGGGSASTTKCPLRKLRVPRTLRALRLPRSLRASPPEINHALDDVRYVG